MNTNYVAEAHETDPNAPMCHICGALMSGCPDGWYCLSCGNRTPFGDALTAANQEVLGLTRENAELKERVEALTKIGLEYRKFHAIRGCDISHPGPCDNRCSNCCAYDALRAILQEAAEGKQP